MNPITDPAPMAGPPMGAAPMAGPAGPPQAPPQPMMGGNPLTAPGGPPPAPAPQGPPPSPEEIKAARTHVSAMVEGLVKVIGLPPGRLTKKAVFDAASDMIAKGAFPTPDSKQQLIGELANLPDDEPDLRKALGMFLLQVSKNGDALNQAFGGA